jgi:uracil-DNA glycosylase
MLQKPSSCKGCPLYNIGIGFVPPQSVAGSNELVVGESPGEEEAKAGVPFVGGAGAWLSAMLAQARLKRDHNSFANTLCCRPPENIYPTDPLWKKAGYNPEDGKNAVEYCWRTHVRPYIDSKRWSRI